MPILDLAQSIAYFASLWLAVTRVAAVVASRLLLVIRVVVVAMQQLRVVSPALGLSRPLGMRPQEVALSHIVLLQPAFVASLGAMQVLGALWP